jgi:murein DD-endopeptidase MepM/ murein hydrolase activator NlpD
MIIASRIQLSLTLCEWDATSMTEQRIYGFTPRRFAPILLPLFLAGCAGEAEKPSQAAAYTPAPASYFTVKLRPGDSLSEVAERYDVKKEDLLALNEIPNQDRIIVGRDLRVPAYGHYREERVTRPASVSRSELPPVAQMRAKRTPAQSQAAIPIPKPRPDHAEPAQQASWFDYDWLRSFTSTQSAADAASAPKLLWPVQGKIISNFGANASGERNDGINILASRGTPVHAAAPGTVAYVGEELKNYGKLVLIRHEDGYVTAYAHSDAVTVSVGDRVARGQTIGYAGATGDVSQPQLHFELRQGTRPLDPKPYLVASK